MASLIFLPHGMTFPALEWHRQVNMYVHVYSEQCQDIVLALYCARD